MGYNVLGIVFGFFLVGEFLDQYIMKIINFGFGLMFFFVILQKLWWDCCKLKFMDGVLLVQMNVDKVIVVNSIVEMLVINWRDVVWQMKVFGIYKRKDMVMISVRVGLLCLFVFEMFIIKKL